MAEKRMRRRLSRELCSSILHRSPSNIRMTLQTAQHRRSEGRVRLQARRAPAIARYMAALFFSVVFIAESMAAKPELRGLWVDGWNPGLHNYEQCVEMVETARHAGFNAIFVEVRKIGDSIHPSTFVPRADCIEGNFDPLATTIRLARDTSGGKQPLQVHAWCVVYRVWTKGRGRPDDPHHVVRAHPDWISLDNKGHKEATDGMFLDPGHPEVQDHLVRILMETVERYDVDGLHLDYIRYPAPEWGYNPESLRLFREHTGEKGTPAPENEQWIAWRQSQVTSLVRRLAGEIADRKPEVQLSAALVPWGGLEMGYEKSSPRMRAMQDWLLWKREGYLDWLCLMNYKREHNKKQADEFRDWCRQARRSPGQVHHAIGMGNYLNTIAASKQQAQAIRDANNNGMMVYCYNNATRKGESTANLLRMMRNDFFQTPVKPPECEWKKTTGALLVHLMDEQGRPRQLHKVILSESGGVLRRHYDSRTDMNGWTAFTRLRPGLYNLIVPNDKDGPYGQPVRKIEIRAGKGERIMTMETSD